jgi:hypothetical protein
MLSDVMRRILPQITQFTQKEFSENLRNLWLKTRQVIMNDNTHNT